MGAMHDDILSLHSPRVSQHAVSALESLPILACIFSSIQDRVRLPAVGSMQAWLIELESLHSHLRIMTTVACLQPVAGHTCSFMVC